ncbi:hypothetical protein [Streptomyces sp. NPDC001480]|uniref:hypothetical protein n=1 Tax=Streptomyces sp. NPDC001480 TaxID=3364577 RepID=UPI0036D1E62E
MHRSRSQAMTAFLPGAVFRHEQRLRGRVQAVDGDVVKKLNEDVIYDEISRYLERWSEDARAALPVPQGRLRQNFVLVSPDLVRFEVFPLVLECVRRSCRRVRTYVKAQQLAADPRCRTCGAPLRQLPYFNAHNCGRIRPMYVPKCPVPAHGYDHIVFENTGSFVTALWRCVGPGCGGAKLQGTSQSPCGCEWKDAAGRSMMRARTFNDTRAYQVHALQLVNIDNSEFRQYQRHPHCGRIAAAHYLNLIDSLAQGLGDASQNVTVPRLSPQEWQQREQQLRQIHMGEEAIEQLRRMMGPEESGLAALPSTNADNARWELLGADRPFVERAAVFDPAQIQRITLDDQCARFAELQDRLAQQTTERAREQARTLGIAEIAVTWEFPVARVAFGYTREEHEPERSVLTGFHNKHHHDGKYPVYVAASDTEALLVTFSACSVLSFLNAKGITAGVAEDESAARQRLLELFTDQDDPEAARAAATVHTVIHTLGHLLLRSLDDGQVGLAENTLAEWVVTKALTVAIYADNVREFTLGSLWTLLSNRVLSWLESTADSVLSCENDPLCHQSSPRCCERCVYLTFGCRLFNDDLDRGLAAEFLRHTAASSHT